MGGGSVVSSSSKAPSEAATAFDAMSPWSSHSSDAIVDTSSAHDWASPFNGATEHHFFDGVGSQSYDSHDAHMSSSKDSQTNLAEYNAGLNANSMWVANTSFSLDGAWFTVIVGRPETRPSHVTDYELLLIDTALTTAYKGIVSDTLGRTPFRHFVMDDMLYVQRQHSAYARSYGRFMMEAFPLRQQGRKFVLNPGPWLSVPR